MGNIVMQKLTLFSILSLWSMVYTNDEKNLVEQNSSELQCQRDFSSELDKCTNGFLLMHHQLGLISSGQNTKISVIYISIHRDLYCKSYINSLQCIHEALSGCSSDTTTSTVQRRLGQIWALTANRICHINDKTHSNDLQLDLPEKISDLLTNNSFQLLEHRGVAPNSENMDIHKGVPLDSENMDFHRGVTPDSESMDLHEDIGQDHSEYSDVDTGFLADITQKLNENAKGSKFSNEFSENAKQINYSESDTPGMSKESAENKLDNFMDQYEPLLKLLENLLSPAVEVMSDFSKTTTIHAQKKSDVTKKPVVTVVTPEHNIKVKYETVLMQKLRITNTGEPVKVKQRYSSGKTGKQSVPDRKQKNRSENNVVKEFEISTENRNSQNRRTHTTTYKWKTKLKF